MPNKNWWKEILKQNGISFTKIRETIINILQNTESHLSAKEIYIIAHKKNKSIGLTSVYRTLDILTKLGLLHKFEFGDGEARYELDEKVNNKSHHHHLVCVRCNKIIDYTDFVKDETDFINKSEKGLSKIYNFDIKGHMIRFYGFCEKCRDK